MKNYFLASFLISLTCLVQAQTTIKTCTFNISPDGDITVMTSGASYRGIYNPNYTVKNGILKGTINSQARDICIFREGCYSFVFPFPNIDSVPSVINLNLKNYESPFMGVKTKKVLFSKISYNIDANKYCAKGSMAPLKYQTTWETDGSLESIKPKIIQKVEEGFYKDSLNIIRTSEMFTTDNSEPDIVLGAEICDLWSIPYQNYIYTKVDVKWTVFDLKKNKVLAIFKTSGAGTSAGMVLILDAMGPAMYDAARALSCNKEFQSLLIKQNTTTVNESPDAPILIDKIISTAYTTQGDLLKYSIESSVTIKVSNGHGSGVIISKSGLILTNFHVIDGTDEIEIILSNGLTMKGEVVRVNETRDVALIKITGGAFGFKAMPINISDPLSVGTDVYAIGTPEDILLGQTVTKGIVSGKRRINEQVYIQTDVSINSGNSGGALINGKGEVVGIVVAKVKQAGTEGLGFAIPISEALDVLKIQIK